MYIFLYLGILNRYLYIYVHKTNYPSHSNDNLLITYGNIFDFFCFLLFHCLLVITYIYKYIISIVDLLFKYNFHVLVLFYCAS